MAKMNQQLSQQIMTPKSLISRAVLESTQEVFPDVRVIVNVRNCSKKSQGMADALIYGDNGEALIFIEQFRVFVPENYNF
ncbi:hypothetical protein QQ045_012024 [Rhodiola kirilowii]